MAGSELGRNLEVWAGRGGYRGPVRLVGGFLVPGWGDGVGAGVGDGLAEVFVEVAEVADEQGAL